MSESVLVDRLAEPIVVVTLNRPDRRNALTIEMMECLCRVMDGFALQARPPVVILRGAGPAFCSGLDLDEAANVKLAERSAQCVARTFQTLVDFPSVTIAAVQGAAYAGGAGLMACCDFVVAADDLRICFPEVRRGLVPALAGLVVRRRLRDGDLRKLLLMAEVIDAGRALEIGLVDQVVPSDQLIAAAQATGATILKGAPRALQETKRLLGQSDSADRALLFSQALEFHKRARNSAEAREGLAAFRGHRDPRWP